jgi:hypothetical protein
MSVEDGGMPTMVWFRPTNPANWATLARYGAALFLHEIVELLPAHPVPRPAIAGQPVDRAFAYLKFAELGFVTPYGESYVRMEHESGG